jgi:hypothetical protein
LRHPLLGLGEGGQCLRVVHPKHLSAEAKNCSSRFFVRFSLFLFTCAQCFVDIQGWRDEQCSDIPRVACFFFFFSVTQQPNSGLGRLIVEVSRSHAPGTTPERVISSSQRPVPTQQTQETNNAFSVIRTRDPNNQAVPDQRFRPHGHRGRPRVSYIAY